MIDEVLDNTKPWHIEVGHCLDFLRLLPNGCVQCFCTSPPYFGLRDYGLPPSIWGGDPDCQHTWVDSSWRASRWGEHDDDNPGEKQATNRGSLGHRGGVKRQATCAKCGAWLGCFGLEPTPEMFVEHNVLLFREVRRVLHPSGILWLNYGDSYARTGKSGGGSQGKRWEECGVDTTGPRGGKWQPPPDGLKQKDLMGIPWRVAFALQQDGWFLRSALPWIKRAAMPDSAKDRPGSSLEYIFLMTKSERYFYDYAAVMRAGTGISGGACFGKQGHDTEGTGAHSRKLASREERAAMDEARNFRNNDLYFDSITPPHGLISDEDGLPIGLDVNPESFPGAHFATFPQRLVSTLLRAGTSPAGCCQKCGAPWRRVTEKEKFGKHDYEGKHLQSDPQAAGRRMLAGVRAARASGHPHDNPFPPPKTLGWEAGCQCDADEPIPCLVADIFGGSGTTMKVARQLGLRAIASELNPEYADMARARITNRGGVPGVKPLPGQLDLFTEAS